jgi:hypothetical protein
MQKKYVEQFLERLPQSPEAETEVLGPQLKGFLLRGRNGALRVIVNDMCLEFAIEDVADIAELPLRGGQESGFAIPVQVTLTRGARLLDVSPASTYWALLGERVMPFAYVVRDTPPPMEDSPRFRALEAAFRKEHGLE